MSVPLWMLALQAVSLVLVGVTSWVAVRVSVARIEQRLDDMARDNERRFAQIERYIGLEGGNGSAFMRKGECELTHRTAEARTAQVLDEVSGLREDVVELGERVAMVEARG